MKSKRSHEGYLLVDHRACPGEGYPTLLEVPTYTCSHCQTVVVLNPLRTRNRGYCPKCDHYVCDGCEDVRVRTGVCLTFKEIIERTQEQAIKTGNIT